MRNKQALADYIDKHFNGDYELYREHMRRKGSAGGKIGGHLSPTSFKNNRELARQAANTKWAKVRAEEKRISDG